MERKRKVEKYCQCVKNFVGRYYKIFAGLILAVAVIPFFLLSYYSRPCVDDFSYGIETHAMIKSGDWDIFSLIGAAWKTDVKFYHEWQGLYTSAFVLALQPGIFREQWYGVGAILLIVLMFGLMHYFIKTVFGVLDIQKNSVLVSAAALVLTLNGMPSIVQGLYWFNGAWNYIPFFYLTLFNLALLIRYEFEKIPQKRWLIGSVLLSFLISGGNHVTGFLNIMLLSLGGGVALKRKKQLLFPWASAILGYFIMVSAPGTAVRQNFFQKPTVTETLRAAFIESFKEILRLVDAQWIVAMLLVLMLAFAVPHICLRPSGKKICLLLFVSWVVFCGILCVPYYAMGNFGEARIANINWLTLMLFSAVNVFYFGVFLAQYTVQRTKKLSEQHAPLCLLVCLVLLACCPGSSVYSVIKELIDGSARTYAAACDERYHQMQNLTKGDILYTKGLPYSKNLRFDDVSDDLEDWRNTAWEDYYGIKIVAFPNESN